MQITDELIDKLADLSKLNFDAEARQEIKKDLARIITFSEQINALDTEGVEPLVYMNEEYNAWRPDRVEVLISREEALQNAPKHDNEHILVPKVIKK